MPESYPHSSQSIQSDESVTKFSRKRSSAEGILALRFDVDSVRCLEEGIPRLMELSRTWGVPFTFFANMGYSFNWAHNVRHFLGKRLGISRVERPVESALPCYSLPTSAKLGLHGVLKTVLLNPRLGDRYRSVLDDLHRDGHELGLHGGTDHVVWQRSLPDLDDGAIRRLLMPAYETFASRYGCPVGFASPGFVHNTTVLRLLEELRFEYSSDMPGEEPFRPSRDGGGSWRHFQAPVNVIGAGRVPLIEEGLALALSHDEIIGRCVRQIRKRKYALLYGHPYVEGVHAEILDGVLDRLSGAYKVVTMREYLRLWKEDQDGQADQVSRFHAADAPSLAGATISAVGDAPGEPGDY